VDFIDPKHSISSNGPGSLLRDEPRSGHEECLPPHSPSSLLADEPQRPYGREEQPSEKGPSSLLDPAPATSDPNAGDVRRNGGKRLLLLWSRSNWRIKAALVGGPFLVLLALMLVLRGALQPAQDPKLLLAHGVELQRKGDLAAAAITFQNLVQQRPLDANARYALGALRHAKGEFAHAERDFHRALELGFDPQQGIAALGGSLLAQGQFQKVLDEITPVTDITNAYGAEVASVRALAYLGSGKIDEAEILFQRVLEVRPDSIDATLGMARIAAIRNRHADAEPLIDRALQIDSRSLDAMLMRAELYTALHRADAARAAFRTVLETHPANPQAHLSLAWMAIQADDPAAAEYHTAMARKAAPESLQGHYIHALLSRCCLCFRRYNSRG
jgi:tetratricopeptide (TPR) repeat protein